MANQLLERREKLLSDLRDCEASADRERITASLVDTYEPPVAWAVRNCRLSRDEDLKEDLRQELRIAVCDAVAKIAERGWDEERTSLSDTYIFTAILRRRRRWEKRTQRQNTMFASGGAEELLAEVGAEDPCFLNIEISEMASKMRELVGSEKFRLVCEMAEIDKSEQGRSWQDIAEDCNQTSADSARVKARRTALRIREKMEENPSDMITLS